MTTDTDALLAREARDALERLYINVRVEYPFGVRDWEMVKDRLDSLAAELERVKADASAFATDAELEARKVDKALSALLRISRAHADVEHIQRIARAAIAEIEGEA